MTDVASPTVEDLEALRGPLTGYCYRMLGSAADTDDAVQDTLIRAHRELGRFDPHRARLSTWVHAIATRICLDALRSAKRRALLAPVPPGGEPRALRPADEWLEPMPDSRTVHATDPAELIVQRDSVRLAFLAALQYLPARQRAALLLRDVYGFSAQETADALDLSVASINSALQRARTLLAEHRPAPSDVTVDAEARRISQRYLDAFEAHDVDALRVLLREDVVQSMPPLAWWVRGRGDVLRLFDESDTCIGDRLMPLQVNGTIGFGQYRLDDSGALRPFAIVVLDLCDGLLGHAITFLGGERFVAFGLPDVFPG